MPVSNYLKKKDLSLNKNEKSKNDNKSTLSYLILSIDYLVLILNRFSLLLLPTYDTLFQFHHACKSCETRLLASTIVDAKAL